MGAMLPGRAASKVSRSALGHWQSKLSKKPVGVPSTMYIASGDAPLICVSALTFQTALQRRYFTAPTTRKAHRRPPSPTLATMFAKVLSIAAIVKIASAVGVNGCISDGCHGERLWEYDIPQFDDCVDVSSYTQPRSVVAGSFQSGQIVYIYSNPNCQNQSNSADSLVCFTLPDDSIQSFSVARAIT